MAGVVAEHTPASLAELIPGTVGGYALVIKNTFIDFRHSRDDLACACSKTRSRSTPALHRDPSSAVPLARLPDVRSRTLTFACEEMLEKNKAIESPRSCTASTCTPGSTACPSPTTVLLKNIPECYTRDMLVDTLNSKGFFGLFDFVYAPVDFGSRESFGYAFINLSSAEDAENFFDAFEGFNSWMVVSDRIAEVDWSDKQGYDVMVDRYRNSPIMHSNVPDEAKPIVLRSGVRALFPTPTQALKPLRVRQSKTRRAKTLGYSEIAA